MGPALQGSVVTVREYFVVLHAYLSQSNDFSDLLLSTEVGHWKVVVVFVYKDFLFTSARKTNKSHCVAPVAPCF